MERETIVKRYTIRMVTLMRIMKIGAVIIVKIDIIRIDGNGD